MGMDLFRCEAQLANQITLHRPLFSSFSSSSDGNDGHTEDYALLSTLPAACRALGVGAFNHLLCVLAQRSPQRSRPAMDLT